MGNIPPKLHNLINWPRLHFGEQCLGFYSDADGGGGFGIKWGALVLKGGILEMSCGMGDIHDFGLYKGWGVK